MISTSLLYEGKRDQNVRLGNFLESITSIRWYNLFQNNTA